MRCTPRIFISRVGLRKATQALWSRESTCAWVDATSEGEAFSAEALMPRLRAQMARSRFLPISTWGKSDVRCAH